MEHNEIIKSLKSNIETQMYDYVEIFIFQHNVHKFQKTNTLGRSISLMFNNILFGQDNSDIEYIKVHIYTDRVSLKSQIIQDLHNLELQYNDKIVLIHNII